MFDADMFLDANTAASTERVLIPLDRGDMFLGIVSEVEAKTGLSGPASKNPGKPWARIDLTVSIEDEYVKETLMTNKVIRTYGIMLDLKEDGSYDDRAGKNINLGLTAKALGLSPTNFRPRDFLGMSAKFHVKYETWKGKQMDKIDGVVPA